MHQILHIVVVGFHHKKGCQVDFSYPPLDGPGEGGLPDAWVQLPSLALPDGAHNTDQDVIYFLLPPREEGETTVYGISCYRQMSSNELTSKSDDVTRSSVQKSVCVLSRKPLFGVLKAKLQLITHAYFNERDFSKVEVLSQMYSNLMDMFEGDLVDGQAAMMDISCQDLFVRFRHRVLTLFKLMLLERKVIFCISPVQTLGDTMVALASLFPKLLEEGLTHATDLCEMQGESSNTKPATSDSNVVDDVEKDVDKAFVPASCISDTEKKLLVEQDPIKEKDSYGFPLSIFVEGNQFHPYQSLYSLDRIRSNHVRGFIIGATNALFLTKKELLDAVVTIDERDVGQVELTSSDMRRILTLTNADLRFCDYILKNIEQNQKSTALFEGGDEWIRLQLRGYLMALAASARSGLQLAVADYGTPFVEAWTQTRNFQLWMAGCHEDLSDAVPGHVFSGQMGVYDVLLRVDHAVSGSEGARKALNAVSSAGKNLGDTGNKMKQSLSSWLRGGNTTAVTQAEEAREEQSVEQQQPTEVSTEERRGWSGEDISSKVRGFTSWLKTSAKREEVVSASNPEGSVGSSSSGAG